MIPEKFGNGHAERDESDAGREPGGESAAVDVVIGGGVVRVERVPRRNREVLDDGGDEIARMLPRSFVDAYEALHLGGLRSVQSAQSTDVRVPPRVTRVRTSTGQMSTRAGAVRGKGAVGDPGWLRSERLFEYRRGVDRKLRKVAREISITLGDEGLENRPRRCTKCKKWGEGEWLYCPRDGSPMEEVER